MDARWTTLLGTGSLLLAAAACSDSEGMKAEGSRVLAPTTTAPATQQPTNPVPTQPTAGNPAIPPPAQSAGSGGAGPAAGAGGAAGPGMTAAGSGGAMMPTQQPAGPEEGDPSKPMVEVPGIPCGAPRAGFGVTPPSVKITNRDVVVAYPCAHEGAPVTFFLFLHGTLDEGIKVGFTMNAWPIHELVDSHNVIVVVPKAIGTQWGNGDNGQDQPHLYEVVDWVYTTFGEKFDIRSMWAQGGSWGAFYLSTMFACDPMFQDRLKGVQLVVGGGCPACSDRLSCMVMQQELEKGGGSPVSDAQKEMLSSGANIDRFATGHGCDGKMGPMDVGATKYWGWPNCDPGWTHSYYLGPGNHADAWDRMAVLRAADEMKATER